MCQLLDTMAETINERSGLLLNSRLTKKELYQELQTFSPFARRSMSELITASTNDDDDDGDGDDDASAVHQPAPPSVPAPPSDPASEAEERPTKRRKKGPTGGKKDQSSASAPKPRGTAKKRKGGKS